MTCPRCNGKSKAPRTIDREDHAIRCRKCEECGYQFKTIEIDLDLYERITNNDKNGNP